MAHGWATIYPDMDFETYSEAGYELALGKVRSAAGKGASTSGIAVVGAAVYSEHPSTEVISLSYDLKDGHGARLWIPNAPPPLELFEYITGGGIIEAHNSSFEYLIWKNVCEARMGWPALPLDQLRCSAAKCNAYSVPPALASAGPALGVEDEKMTEGKRLIRKFSCPHPHTKKRQSHRITVADDPTDAALFYAYNVGDIVTESQVSTRCPDLSPTELELWLLDQRSNMHGCYADTESLNVCQRIIDEATGRGQARIMELTGGTMATLNSGKQLLAWLASVGVVLPNMQAETVTQALEDDSLPPAAREALGLRSSLGSASVKKVASMLRYTCRDGRMRGLLQYCGANRTGRFAGRGPQPQNLPNSGPAVSQCPECGVIMGGKWKSHACTCGGVLEGAKWGPEAVDAFLNYAPGKSLPVVEHYWGDAVACVSGSIRGMFCAAPGYDFISSDYSAIEAVVLAFLAGEEWRMEVFRTHGKIYEMSASKIVGVPFEEMLKYRERTGDHHPTRKTVGKVAELASGYQGGLNAWKAFGADKYMDDDEIRKNVRAWRVESPMIVKFWGEVERLAHAAVEAPGTVFKYRDLAFEVVADVLFVILPSGRRLNYHQPRLTPVVKFDRPCMELSFMGSHPLTKKWVRLTTFGGRLTENITQAVARDILTHALVELDKAGYPMVLQIHDEVVCEVPVGVGSVEELERIMATLPEWCASWPIKAADGWRGKRYRKG
ncbi:MAG: hypothetical protein GY767_22575 [Shimia sp.]|nr:hypothetical protein [Shimia sp.]